MRTRTPKPTAVERAESALADARAKLDAALVADAEEVRAKARADAEVAAAETIETAGAALAASRAQLVASTAAAQQALPGLLEQAESHRRLVAETAAALNGHGLRLDSDTDPHPTGAGSRLVRVDGAVHRAANGAELVGKLQLRVTGGYAGRSLDAGVRAVLDDVPLPPKVRVPQGPQWPAHEVVRPRSWDDYVGGWREPREGNTK